MQTTRRTALVAIALAGLGARTLAQKPPVPAAATVSDAAAAPALQSLGIKTSLDVANRQAVVAEDFVFKATLRVERPGPSLSGREIAFTLAGSPACKATTDASGAGSCHYRIPPMPQALHPYEAVFKTDSGLLGSKAEAKVLVGKAQTKMSILTSSTGWTPGATVDIVARLVRALDGSVIDGKPVSFSLNGADLGNATTVNGSAHKSTKIPDGASGDLKFEVFFVTDDFYVGSSAQNTRTIPKMAFLNVLSAPAAGRVGANGTVKAQLARGPYVSGQQSPVGGIAGQTLRFQFRRSWSDFQGLGTTPKTGITDVFQWTATTDGQGVATATGPLERIASDVLVSISSSPDGWQATSVTRSVGVEGADTLLTAAPLAGNIGKTVALRVHATSKLDGGPRKNAAMRVTKLDQSPLPAPLPFTTGPTGDGSRDILLPSTWGIGSHTLTIAIEGDAVHRDTTGPVPLTINPSQ